MELSQCFLMTLNSCKITMMKVHFVVKLYIVFFILLYDAGCFLVLCGIIFSYLSQLNVVFLGMKKMY